MRRGARRSFYFSFPRLKCEVSLSQINSKVLKSGQLVSMSQSFRCLIFLLGIKYKGTQGLHSRLCVLWGSLRDVFQTTAFWLQAPDTVTP